MYTRFYNSIINPRNLIQFRNDSLFRVVLYILLFALLLSTRTIIDTITYDGLSTAVEETVKQEFVDVNTTCEIIEAELQCTKKESTLMFQTLGMTFHTDSFDNWNPSIYSDYGYNFVLHDDTFELVISGQSLYAIPISELPEQFQNFDFELYETDKTAFFNIIFDVVDDVMLSSKNVWGPALVFVDFVVNLIMFLFFILLSSWMLRVRFRQIKYRHLFTMSVYSSTALFVIMIIDSLYNLNFFLVIILLFVAIRQNSQLSLELHRRLTKKP